MSGKDMRVGVDVGGTFTDVVVAGGGRLVHGKSDTTAFDLQVGIHKALDEAAAELDYGAGELLGDCGSLVYSTTVGTNALVEHRGPVLGLITTHGFENTLAIGRGRNWADGLAVEARYDRGRAARPQPLVPRHLVVGVRERVGSHGEVLVGLRDEEVLNQVQRLVDAGVRGFVVSLLYSYANPVHERRIRELIRAQYPPAYLGHMPVYLSSELSPQMGEYRRTMTCILDAFLRLETEDHLVALQESLRDGGYSEPLLLAKCTGGASSLSRTRPIQLFGSGPVSGVVGAGAISRDYGLDNVFLTDMGGTSFDLGLVLADAERTYDYDPVIDRWRVQLPLVAHWSIGAGGGSIAQLVDGILKVGPASARSLPGPACYARGGTEPTVTDADVVLGYINPDYFLGGHISLDAERARHAINERIAEPLGIDTYQAAWDIKRLVDGTMGQEMYRVAAQRSGLDPREFVAFAYGGAGPVHAAGYAHAADVSRVATFDFGSVGGAFGTLSLDILQTYERTHSNTLLGTRDGSYNDAAIGPLNEAVVGLSAEARRDMSEEGFDLDALAFELEVLLRFGQQRHSLPVTRPAEPFESTADIERLVRDFVTAYADAYGKGSVYLNAGVEVLGLRLNVTGTLGHAPGRRMEGASTESRPVPIGRRPAYWGPEHGEITTDVYRRHRLSAGAALDGPVLVESVDTVCVVPPGWGYRVDSDGAGWLELKEVPR
jgi:N-methylhydantoinase A/acetophenone carboxylase